MRLHPEARDSYITKFVEEFSPAVLKNVAAIPAKAGQEPPPGLVDSVAGSSHIARAGAATYKIDDDNSVRVTFPLQGNLDLFRRYTADFLGKDWKYGDGAVETTIAGDLYSQKVEANVTGRVSELVRALSAFTDAHETAKALLKGIADQSYTERVRLEETLQKHQIMPARRFSDDDLDDEDPLASIRRK